MTETAMSVDELPSGVAPRGLWCFFLLVFFLQSVAPSVSLFAGDSGELLQYQPRFYPFDGGESAEYRASWNGIPVASAEIQTVPLVIDGKKFYQVKVQARTWRYLELIWKMRDVIESTFEAKTLHPVRFIFRQRENRKKIDTTARFDPTSKKWTVHRQQGSSVRDYEFVSQHAMDPISAVYLARSLDFKVGDALRMEVFGGNSRYLVIMDIVGREPITVKTGVFEAYKIIPRVINLTSSGYAGRVRQATVWISADEKRRPLRVVSQVFIGYVSIDLVEGKS
ncbi:DUF3108 domain-containing protein [bacterium]|nr:MAG: DUF3108 domain-containing protein [bacterium]